MEVPRCGVAGRGGRVVGTGSCTGGQEFCRQLGQTEEGLLAWQEVRVRRYGPLMDLGV